MKVLHTFSNWKWTGPAEPAVRLAAALQETLDVTFACGRCPYPDLQNLVAIAAKARGLPLIEDLILRKHFDPLSGARDFVRLKQRVVAGGYDVVHAHLMNDHLLVGAAARRSRSGARVVRTVYGGPDLASRLRTRIGFARLTDGVVCASEAAADVVRSRVRFPESRLRVIPGAVDVDRFAPDRLAQLRDAAREELGLDPGTVAFGIVARMQRHRRYDLLLHAFARAARRDDSMRLVIIGRGTHEQEVARGPAGDLGVSDRIRFTGYREGGAYDAALAALDVGIFLVPGSDGSCRAARELAASSLPLMVTPRPPLPEIVDDATTGMVLAETEEAFEEAFVSLAQDPATRRRMGAAARDRAARYFSLPVQASAVSRFYSELVELGPHRGRS